jgi:hypothetical protein
MYWRDLLGPLVAQLRLCPRQLFRRKPEGKVNPVNGMQIFAERFRRQNRVSGWDTGRIDNVRL